MVATAEEDSRLFLHHQQREPEYARGKPYQPYPVVVLTLVHNLPMFLSQLMINLWNAEGIRFCFFLWNYANDHECQSKCLHITFAEVLLFIWNMIHATRPKFFLWSLIFLICLFKEAIWIIYIFSGPKSDNFFDSGIFGILPGWLKPSWGKTFGTLITGN